MSKHQGSGKGGLLTEEELHERYENSLNSGHATYDEDLSPEDNYEKWKYETGRESEDDLHWEGDYDNDDLKDDDDDD